MKPPRVVLDDPAAVAVAEAHGRAALAVQVLPTVREMEASLGRAVVVVVLDPTDPRAAAVMPALAAVYSATDPALRPSAVMAIAHGGIAIYSLTPEGGYLCHEDSDHWRGEAPAVPKDPHPVTVMQRGVA